MFFYENGMMWGGIGGILALDGAFEWMFISQVVDCVFCVVLPYQHEPLVSWGDDLEEMSLISVSLQETGQYFCTMDMPIVVEAIRS